MTQRIGRRIPRTSDEPADTPVKGQLRSLVPNEWTCITHMLTVSHPICLDMHSAIFPIEISSRPTGYELV